jgi:hypothetical protein
LKRALVIFREGLHYRREVFALGLQELGYEVYQQHPHHQHKYFAPGPDDVLVIWNRYGAGDAMAMEFEAVGAAVIVVENGYLGKNWIGRDWYAVSLNHHNGAGLIPYGGPERWDSFGFEIEPMRDPGEEVILLPQRGIGEKGVAMPADWKANALRVYPNARVRLHPGKNPAPDLIEDCARAWHVFTHGSGAGIKCMAAGIRCVSTWPRWIGYEGCNILQDTRLGMFRRLAWAQWTIDEVKNGEALYKILSIR